MEEARFRVDVTVDERALHEVYLPHFRRVAGGGGGLGDVRLQLGQRALVRGERRAVDRHPPHRVGVGRLRHLRLHRRTARPGPVGRRRPRDRDALPPAAGPAPPGGRRVRCTWRSPTCEARVEATVATLLRFAGVFAGAPDPSVLAAPEHRALAREAAAASMVLLRNEGPLLPVAPDQGRVAVVGRLAAVANLGDGGSSDVYPPEVSTLLEGIRRRLSGGRRRAPRHRCGGGRGCRPGRRRGGVHQGRRG